MPTPTLPPRPLCTSTLLAVIYTDLQESRFPKRDDPLVPKIYDLENFIWTNTHQRYLGIFTVDEGAKVSFPFVEFAKFHSSTDTYHMVTKDPQKPSAFDSPALLELLRSNGTTHVFIIGSEVTATALDALKHGFKVCVVQSLLHGANDEDGIKAAGAVWAERPHNANAFLHEVILYRGPTNCDCDFILSSAGVPARWCSHKRNEFLWRTCMRLRLALSAVMSAGFGGPVWPPRWEGGRPPTGRWLSTPEQNAELADAIDAAADAGIPTGDAIHVSSYTDTTSHPVARTAYEKSMMRTEIKALREEMEVLRVRLAKAERTEKN